MVIIWLRTIAWAILRRWPDSFADRITAAEIFGVDAPPVVTEYVYVDALAPVVTTHVLTPNRAIGTLTMPADFKAVFHDTLRRNDPHSPVSHVART